MVQEDPVRLVWTESALDATEEELGTFELLSPDVLQNAVAANVISMSALGRIMGNEPEGDGVAYYAPKKLARG